MPLATAVEDLLNGFFECVKIGCGKALPLGFLRLDDNCSVVVEVASLHAMAWLVFHDEREVYWVSLENVNQAIELLDLISLINEQDQAKFA